MAKEFLNLVDADTFSQLFDENEIIKVKSTGRFSPNDFIPDVDNAYLSSPDGKIVVSVLMNREWTERMKKDKTLEIVYLGNREVKDRVYIQVRPLFTY